MNEDDDLFSFLLQDKPNQLLRVLISTPLDGNEYYGSALASEVGTTYAHTVKIIGELEEQGIVKRKKKGRRKYVSLTEKGEKLAESAAQYMQTIEELSQQE